MSNFDVSYFVHIRDKFSKNGEKVAKVAEKINKTFEKVASKAKAANPHIEKLKRTLGSTFDQVSAKAASMIPQLSSLKTKFSSTFDKIVTKVTSVIPSIKRLKNSLKGVGEKMNQIGKDMSVKVTAPILAFGGIALSQAAKMETLSVSFDTMLGSAEKSKKVMADLTRFTATTPFQLDGVAKAGKQLLAFGVTQSNLIPRMRMLGDISAGANVPLSDMAQIFGKAKAKGKLMTEEILQMSERGIPIVDVLAKGFGVTKEKVFEMASKSQISFDAMQKSLKSMTNQGGIFFDQTNRQSQTLAGRWSTLKDNISLTAAAIGEVIIDVFGLNEGMKSLSDVLVTMPDKIRAFASENPNITRFAVIFASILAVAGPLLIILGQVAMGIAALSKMGFIASAVLGVMKFGLLGVGAAAAFAGKAFMILFAPVTIAIATFMAFFHGTQLLLDMFKNKFPNAFLVFSDFLQTHLGFAFEKVDELLQKVSSARELLPSFLGGGDSNISLSNKSQTDINLNMTAPEGAIQSIKSTTTGNSNANLGTNLSEV